MEIPSQSPYSFGFTAGGMGLVHCQVLAGLHLELGNWQKVRTEGLPTNALRQGRSAYSVRVGLLHETRAHDAPFCGNLMRKAKAAYEALKTEVGKRLMEAVQAALKEFDDRRETLRQHLLFTELAEEKAEEIFRAPDTACEQIRNARLIPVIRDTVTCYLDTEFPRQLSRLQEAKAGRRKPAGEGCDINGGGGETTAEPAFVSLMQLLNDVEFDKKVLPFPDDDRTFVDAIKAALEKTIVNKKGVTL